MTLIHWETWACFSAIKCSDAPTVGIGSQWHPQCVPYVSRSSHFWTNLVLAPHGPVKFSSRTDTGPPPGVCRPLCYRTLKKALFYYRGAISLFFCIKSEKSKFNWFQNNHWKSWCISLLTVVWIISIPRKKENRSRYILCRCTFAVWHWIFYWADY